jgi:L-2-hydroxyglutarate oxidase
MHDVIVIGAGIVGLSTAWQLQQRYPDTRILVLEKEPNLAQHQTGHNSGVIHAGVYYSPGSMKARFCTEGVNATLAFCQKHNIPVQQCGKLLVATTPPELEQMEELYQRCHANGLVVEKLDSAQLRAKEPNITGLGAVWVPATGIVDYRQICRKMAAEFLALGGELQCNTPVSGLTETASVVTVKTPGKFYSTRYLVVSAGLQADRLVDMMGLPRDFAIVPFRGEYYRLPASRNALINHLVYPIPDPDMPFLGVHLTRMIDGSITVGPNAVLGWKREGYGRLNICGRDVWDNLRFGGLWRLIGQHLLAGFGELRDSWSKRGYLKRIQKYCPQLTLSDLQPYPAGVRAQAVLRDGSMVNDFLFVQSARSLHVCNAPSPAATSAIPIGEHICFRLEQMVRAGMPAQSADPVGATSPAAAKVPDGLLPIADPELSAGAAAER